VLATYKNVKEDIDHHEQELDHSDSDTITEEIENTEVN
jgi:hypothetical protein